MLIALGDKEPRIDPGAYVAPTATLIGDVVVEAGASVWFGAVLRADYARIVVGQGSTVEDNVVLHTAPNQPTVIGANVTVGHLAMLQGCVIEDGALIGLASVVLNHCRIGRRAMLAAGTVVPEGMSIPPEVLAAGVPAEVKKPLGGRALEWVEMAAREYQSLRLRYLKEARVVAP